MIVQQLLETEKRLAVVGLGYVGLPVALAFAKKVSVIGYDLNANRIEQLQKNIDVNKELEEEDFQNTNIAFTSEISDIADAVFYIVAVPTPVDAHHVPDLSYLKRAAATVGKLLQPKNYVVFESTVYPGCTEEVCIPILEKASGLKAGKDFKVGYSPERINPGDAMHSVDKVIKVVSGMNAACTEEIASVYELIATAGIFKASSIKVAEAAKVIENTQRDLNIAFMNELSLIFNKMNINTFEVLEAAATKWNFLSFTPGLVGGHCIGVDPYYLTYKAAELGIHPKLILAGRSVNDKTEKFVAEKILQHILQHNGNVKESKVLVMGITFKENVSDIRNSQAAALVKTLQSYFLTVEVVDYLASAEQVQQEYAFSLQSSPSSYYDAVIIAVAHAYYLSFSDEYFASITKQHALIADLKGTYRNKITSRAYWSL